MNDGVEGGDWAPENLGHVSRDGLLGPSLGPGLLPCPFCGGEAKLISQWQHRTPWVSCEGCTGWIERDVWNRRAPAQPPPNALHPAAETDAAIDTCDPVRVRDPLLKRPVWFFSMEMDQDPIACMGDDVPHVLRCIRDQIEGDMTLLDDGEIATYQLKRVDMSDVEVEALPEI